MIGGLKKLDLKNQEKLKKKWMFDKYDNINGRDSVKLLKDEKTIFVTKIMNIKR